jgi:DNA-binding MarR family transcriptional regulator
MTSASPFTIENLNDYDLSGLLMLQVSSLWKEIQEQILKKHYGITHIQYVVLASICWHLLNEKKEVTQIMLSKYTRIAPMTISQTFKVLEKRGYVYRKTNSSDVRAKSVFLTPEGEEVVRKTAPAVMAADSRFFGSLEGVDIKKFNSYMLGLLRSNDY